MPDRNTMDKQSASPSQSASSVNATNISNATERPSTSGSRSARYQDDGEVPGPSGLPLGTRQNVREQEYDDDWYLETAYSSSSSDECLVSESFSGHDVRYTWSSASAGDRLPDITAYPNGTRKMRYHRHGEDPPATIREEYNWIYGSLSVESISSNQSSLDLYYFPEFSDRYNVFEKPIVGDTGSPWQQRLELQRLEELSNRKFDALLETNALSEVDIGEDPRERISSWLEKVQKEMEHKSLPELSCRSDTELSCRKRKRNDSTQDRSSAKRSKSETDVRLEQRKKRKRFAKVGERCKTK